MRQPLERRFFGQSPRGHICAHHALRPVRLLHGRSVSNCAAQPDATTELPAAAQTAGSHDKRNLEPCIKRNC